MKKILLTGGGTAGHVSPNIALLPLLRKRGFEVEYAGSRDGIERELMQAQGVTYHPLATGKLRRYLSAKNLADAGRVVKGVGDAMRIVKKVKPDIIFSKGGFVGVPVVVAGYLRGVPVVIHESDISPGLANRIAMRFAKKICVSFPETLARVPQKKAALTGTPIRAGLTRGDKTAGLRLCGFSGKKPILLVMGGSQGSKRLNAAFISSLPMLLPKYDVVHICGKNNKSEYNPPGYVQFEFLGEELFDVLAACDFVISRAGANAINEFLAVKKPMLLIPLSRDASRGDQIENAQSFSGQGYAEVLLEENITPGSLSAAADALYLARDRYISAMGRQAGITGAANVVKVISDTLRDCEKSG